MTTQPENSVVISPIGDFDNRLLDRLAKEISALFGCRTTHKSLLKDLEFALDSERRQYHSTPIIETLAGKAPPDAIKVLGITRVDDTLPQRFLTEPRPSGMAEGVLPDLDAMLEEYYRLRDWTPEGTPSPQRLAALELA